MNNVLLATSSPSTRLSALPSDSVAQRSLPQVNALGGHGLGGFGQAVEYPAFYSYAYPEPLGFYSAADWDHRRERS